MRRRRPRTAVTFLALGIVLLLAIALGQKVGDRVLSLATSHRTLVPDLSITPAPESSDAEAASRTKNWRRLDIVSVATDPAFPDPRVTAPPPPPPPTPRPTHSPRPLTLPSPDEVPTYTSPPLPMPLVSHDPSETAPPGEPTP